MFTKYAKKRQPRCLVFRPPLVRENAHASSMRWPSRSLSHPVRVAPLLARIEPPRCELRPPTGAPGFGRAPPPLSRRRHGLPSLEMASSGDPSTVNHDRDLGLEFGKRRGVLQNLTHVNSTPETDLW
jgi:hypothetical protein